MTPVGSAPSVLESVKESVLQSDRAARALGGFVTRTRPRSWQDGLVTGNGTIGAVLHERRGDDGDDSARVLTLTHERLFLPRTAPLPPPPTVEILDEIRDLLARSEFQQAADAVVTLAASHGYTALRETDPLVPAVALEFTGAPIGDADDVVREVEFSTGLATVRNASGAGAVVERAFVSRADGVAVWWLEAADGRLSGTLRLVTPSGAGAPQGAVHTVRTDSGSGPDAELTYQLSYPGGGWPGAVQGVRAAARVVIKATDADDRSDDHDGTDSTHGADARAGRGSTSSARPNAIVDASGDTLTIKGTRCITVIVAVEPIGTVPRVGNPRPAGPPPADGRTAQACVPQTMLERLARLPADPAELLARHRPVHAELLGHSILRLHTESADPLPTTERLLDTDEPAAAGLIDLVFEACRYEIASSTGELPPGLQGVFAGGWAPPWSADYTLDGNLQAAVGAHLALGVPQLLLPVFDLLDELADDFRLNAQRLYGAPGLLLPVRAGAHGLANHFGPQWCLTFWTGSGPWLARLYWDYVQYTGDLEFLRSRALPFMAEVAEFTLHLLRVDHTTGVLHFSPSYSPENHPGSSSSQACVDATVDVALARDLLSNLLSAAGLLDLADPRVDRWRSALDRLPDYRVTAVGEFAEYLPAALTDNAHRHSSHLFPFLYEIPADVAARPDLLDAARATVRARLRWLDSEENDGEMAFGLAVLGWAAAHLGMAQEAERLVLRMARSYVLPSMVTTHNVHDLLNVDIGGGFPALIAEMLVQSSRGRVTLLPALPDRWRTGCVTNLHCRGQVVVSELRWTPDGLQVELISPMAQHLSVFLPWPGRHSGRPEPATAIEVELSPNAPVLLTVERAGSPRVHDDGLPDDQAAARSAP